MVERVSKKVRRAVEGIRKKKNNNLHSKALRGTNPLRSEFNSLVRSVWKQLPNVESISDATFRSYSCTDASYDEVVYEVSRVVHEFLFVGLESLKFDGFDSQFEVLFPTISGKVVHTFCAFGGCSLRVSITEIKIDIINNHKSSVYNYSRKSKTQQDKLLSVVTKYAQANVEDYVDESNNNSEDDDDNEEVKLRQR